MDEKKIDTSESLAADLERWADEDIHNVGRDVLRRTAQGFARRVRRLAFSVPEVRVVDEKGRTVLEGFYFEYPERQGYPINDGAPEEIPTARCVACYDPGDWGMANTPRIVKVTPPHRIVFAGKSVSPGLGGA